MTRLGLLLLAALHAGCNDDFLVPSAPTEVPDGATGWCAVREIFASDCLVCHSAASRLGGLDLETDPRGALVGVPAEADPALTLVVAGEPGGSFLLAKLRNEQAAGQGGVMPPTGALDAALIALVDAWIAEGAPDTCDQVDTDTDTPPGRYHPEGFADPTRHGHEAKYQEQRCVDCHGADLTGQGAALSCDTCHPVGWRTDCTFCHGDPAEGSGSPPVHLSGVDDGAQASFVPHRVHTGATSIKAAYACAECHATPADVLSLGHLFVGDDTPGVAEVVFTAGLSDAARWDNGTCSNLWCHGNGRGDNGTMQHEGTVDGCAACHPGPASRSAWRAMSGEHEKHLDDDLRCADCHADTVDGAHRIVDVTRHVDGEIDVALPSTITFDGSTCTGTCHGEGHAGRRW